MKRESVNIFFACDDKYAAYMAVTMESIKENSAQNRDYHIRILHTGIGEEKQALIKSELSEKNFKIDFVDINDKINEISDRLHTRDYYSKTTYYRLFIPNLFPEIEKALYLDCDIVVTGDISELYSVDIGDNLVAAVRDEFVFSNKILSDYATNRIGHKSPELYFNAGVLLMNLSEMRRVRFEKMFLRLIEEVKFVVAQDQDYLNVLCKDRVTYVTYSWNFMPLPGTEAEDAINLIHFNLDNKPWQRKGILYDEVFWEIARRSAFSKEIHRAKGEFSFADIRRSKEETAKLIETARLEAENTEENAIIKEKIEKIFSEFAI